MKRKSIIASLLLLFFCAFLGTVSVHADVDGQIDRLDRSSTTDDSLKSDSQKKDTVKESSPTKDPQTLYDRYKNNSFEIMTKEQKGLNPFKKTAGKITGVLKNFFWGWAKIQGTFNAALVKAMFDMDIISPIKQSMLNLTSIIATNMLSIAGTIGIAFISMVMAIKFIGEQRFKRAVGVFCMTILIFTGLVVLKDSNTSNSLVNTLYGVDQAVEKAIVNVNPVLNNRPDKASEDVNTNLKSAGDMIASKVFYTNVYEPYLLMNYGKTNSDKIRSKKVKYSGKEYDRINILLDNDAGTDLGDKIQDKVADYESDKLNNKTISYTHNLNNTFFAMFYLFVNFVQTFALFVLCFLRIVFAAMQLFLIPLLPILLIVALFMTNVNPFVNFGKAFGMTIFMKAMAGFACILVTSFLSIGFQLAGQVDNTWEKLITILVYLLAPFGIFYFRTFLGSMFTGQMTLQNALSFATRPFSTQTMMRKNAKARKKQNEQYAKDEKAKRKAAKENEQKKALENGKRELNLKQPKDGSKNNLMSPLRRSLKPNNENGTKEPSDKEKDNKLSKREQLQKNLETLNNQKDKKEESADNQSMDNPTTELRPKRVRQSREQASDGEEMNQVKEGETTKNPQTTTTKTEPKSEVKESKNHQGRSKKRGEAAQQETATTATNTAKANARERQRSTVKQSTATVPTDKVVKDTKAPQVQSGVRRSGIKPTSNNVASSSKGTPSIQRKSATVQSKPAKNQATTVNVTPAVMTAKSPRSVNTTSGAIKRRAPHVQEKMGTSKRKSMVEQSIQKPKQPKATAPTNTRTAPQKNIKRTINKRQTVTKNTLPKGQRNRKPR